MTQYTEMSCPSCQRSLRVRAEYLGKLLNCKHCNKTFRASPPGEQATAGEPPAQLNEARLRILSLEESLQQTKIELAARTVEQTNGARILRELQAERDQFQQQALQTMTQMAEQANEIEPLRADRDRLQTELKAQQEELQAHRGQAQQTQDEMTELRKKLIAAVNAVRNLKDIQNERDRLHEESGHLRSQLQTMTADAERIGPLSEEVTTLRGQEQQWAAERAALENDKSQGQAELERLQAELASEAGAAAELRNRLEMSEAECRRLSTEFEATHAGRRETEADRERTAAAYVNRERQWAEEYAALEEDLTREHAEVQRLQKAETELRARLEDSEAECRRLAAEYEPALAARRESEAERERAAAAHLEQERHWAAERAALVGTLAREHTELQRALEASAELQPRLEAGDEECRRLAAALGATADARRAAETELESVREKMHALETEIGSAESRGEGELEELRGKIAWYQQEVDVLRKSLSSFGIQVEY